MRAASAIPAVLAVLAAGPLRADPAGDLALSLSDATGGDLGEAALAAARDDLGRADPEEVAVFLPQIAAMGRLARAAEHPATRSVMRDLHRQLVENLVADPAASPSLALLEEADPLLDALDLGVGLAASDVAAAAALEALATDLPEDAAEADPGDDAGAWIAATFAAEGPGNQQFIARLDAWHAGLVAVWPDLTPAERRLAAGVAVEDAVPPPDLTAKVVGSADLIGWLGAMDVALTDAERAAEPGLVAFLGEGHMTGGATAMILDRVASATVATTGLAGVTTMMELNGQLLQGDLSGPSVAGEILGLE